MSLVQACKSGGSSPPELSSQTGDPLHRFSTNDKWGKPTALLPLVIHRHFISFVDIKGQVVGLTPQYQVCHLVQVALLVVIGDKTQHHGVIGELDDGG